MTSEMERITILEGKIGQIIEYINRLTNENEKLRQQVKELKAGMKDYEEQAKKLARLQEELEKYRIEREGLKEKIEALIMQIDKIGL
ncbi:MAG: hypothetical protein ACUVR0_04620 [Candidatus Aminicenantales bacterium]